MHPKFVGQWVGSRFRIRSKICRWSWQECRERLRPADFCRLRRVIQSSNFGARVAKEATTCTPIICRLTTLRNVHTAALHLRRRNRSATTSQPAFFDGWGRAMNMGSCGHATGPSDYFKLKDEIWIASALSGTPCTKCARKALRREIRCSDLDASLPWWGRTNLQEYADGMIDAISGRIPARDGLYRGGFDFGLRVATSSTQAERDEFLQRSGRAL
jgi:hypothetical protein